MNNHLKSKQGREKRQKGITLVALVITIVILIILATISINAVFGDSGLIQRAQEAKDMTANSTIAEQEELDRLYQEYINIVGDPTEQKPTKIMEVTRDQMFERTTKVSDASGDILYVPGGFGIADGYSKTTAGTHPVRTGCAIRDQRGLGGCTSLRRKWLARISTNSEAVGAFSMG